MEDAREDVAVEWYELLWSSEVVVGSALVPLVEELTPAMSVVVTGVLVLTLVVLVVLSVVVVLVVVVLVVSRDVVMVVVVDS